MSIQEAEYDGWTRDQLIEETLRTDTGRLLDYNEDWRPLR